MINRMKLSLLLLISVTACNNADDAINYDMALIDAAFDSAAQISDLRSFVVAR